MAVVERKDSEGVVYYVANEWNGRQKSERVGRNRREAERRDEAMKKEIANGTYQPPKQRKELQFGDFTLTYHAKRTIKSKADERALSRNHMEPRAWLWKKPLSQFRPADCDRLIAELRALTKLDGSRRLTDKSISDVLQLMRRIFASAIRAELCDRQPVVLEAGTWDHSAKIREPYTAAEAVVLTRHHKVPWPTRVLIALWMLAGLRQGEGCGVKWKRLDLASAPLAGLEIAEQWRGETLKTKKTRIVPVHPELRAILQAWADTGFELYTGRKPTPEDYIVPEMDGFGVWNCFGPSTSYRRFIDACKATGVRPRTLHSCRHTFVTLCRRGGARKDVLEKVTHNSGGDIVDRYTHFDWAPLCEAVSCLRLESPQAAPPLLGNGGEIELPELPEEGDFPDDSPGGAEAQLVVCPPRISRRRGADARSAIGEPGIQAGVQGISGDRRGSLDGQRFDHALRRAIETRRQGLMVLAEIDPEGARPGLALCRGQEALLAKNGPAVVEALKEAAEALGLTSGGKR